MSRKPRDPFDVTLNEDQRKALGLWLCDELQRGLDARGTQEKEVDYWWQLYEQARTRNTPPWPGAADLTSYFPHEKTTSLHARIMKTVWSDPLWNVEGWGDASEKAPFVEEFHQWKAEEERLQQTIDKLVLQALVEPRGLIEIAEGTEMRTSRKRILAAVETQTDPMTGMTSQVFNEDGSPALQTDPMTGDLIPVKNPDQELSAETIVDSKERVRTGPVFRILPYKDSVILPGHARDKEDIWGYGKKFWRSYDSIKAKSTGPNALYDREAVERMTATTDRETDDSLKRSQMDAAPSDYGKAEKELWEILVLVDLSSLMDDLGHGKVKTELQGERWYLTTIHLPNQSLLRVQHDDLERSRFVPVILFPRVDRATEGYSFIGHQMLTISEEHTAWRNMAADRAHASLNSPVKRLQGALWDPYEQPLGPGAVIDVRDMREVEAMVIPDLSAPAMEHIQMMERTAERLAGINDIASGQVASESRTLGEVQMATEQSFVRMDLIVRRFQEAFEDIAQIRHAIWKRTLAEQPEGIDAPQSVLQNLEGRGVAIDQFLPDKKIMASLLEGAYRFKPHGSVETADKNKLRQDFVAFIQMMPQMLQMFPIPTMNILSASRYFWRQAFQLFHVQGGQAFLGSASQDLMATQQADLMGLMQQMGGPPGMPGAPPPGMAGPQDPQMPGAAPPGAPGPQVVPPPGPQRPQ